MTSQTDVYAAEDDTIAKVARRFGSFQEVEWYLDALLRDPWFEAEWPDVTEVTVERFIGRRFAGVGNKSCLGIALRRDALRLDVVLHELSHLCAPEGSGHTLAWRYTFLKLVRREMGFYAWADLLAAYKAKGLVT